MPEVVRHHVAKDEVEHITKLFTDDGCTRTGKEPDGAETFKLTFDCPEPPAQS